MSTSVDNRTQNLNQEITKNDLNSQKYLTFRIDKEYFGIEILQAQEIIGMQELASIPKTPPHIRGVFNLRGRILPVLDMRAKFGLPSTPDTKRTCIVIVSMTENGRKLSFGLVVDQVSEVKEISNELLDETPYMESNVEDHYFEKIAKVDDRVIMLLDLKKIIFEEDKDLLKKLSKEDQEEVEAN